jgi:hypothetical protein
MTRLRANRWYGRAAMVAVLALLGGGCEPAGETAAPSPEVPEVMTANAVRVVEWRFAAPIPIGELIDVVISEVYSGEVLLFLSMADEPSGGLRLARGQRNPLDDGFEVEPGTERSLAPGEAIGFDLYLYDALELVHLDEVRFSDLEVVDGQLVGATFTATLTAASADAAYIQVTDLTLGEVMHGHPFEGDDLDGDGMNDRWHLRAQVRLEPEQVRGW